MPAARLAGRDVRAQWRTHIATGARRRHGTIANPIRPPQFPVSVKQASSREDMLTHVGAMAGTLLILLLFARLLLHMPAPAPASREESAMQVTLLTRELVPPVERAAPRMPPRSTVPARRAGQTTPPVAAAPPSPARTTSNNSTQAQLYTRDGRVRMGEVVNPLDPGYAAVPPGMTDERALDKARKVLERPNPIDYRGTRFEKDWKSDGTLGDVAMQSLNRGMKKINGVIWGKEVEAVKARPPPDVRFNPALAENKADLGSEATGDAYKAAPIAHEDVPDLKGAASRRIREELAALEAQPTACDAARRTRLLAPARTHLADLERVEHALAHDADPVMAEQMLPRQADSAYDLARRALWYARKQWAVCG